jgi:uncharacterized protein
MGCSGIVASSLLHPVSTLSAVSKSWKFVFLGSFVLAVNIIAMATSSMHHLSMISPTTASIVAYIISGLCVGVGTRLSNGCTSGHGVCGLARFSTRSLTSVMTFLSAGMFTATMIASPYTPWATYTAFLRQDNTKNSPTTSTALTSVVLAVSVSLAIMSYFSQINSKSRDNDNSPSDPILYKQKSYGAALSGALFALGLGVSGMTQTSKVQGFLDLNPLFRNDVIGSYDPTLLTVLGSAVPISALGYFWQRSRRSKTTWCGADWSGIPTRTDIDGPLVIGSMLFGVGWGLVGLCPGPGLWSAAAGVADILLTWFPAFLFGSFVGDQVLASRK